MRDSSRQRIIGYIPRPRFETYLRATGGNENLALELYLWNIDAAAAVASTVGIAEVALRSTFDLVLKEWNVHQGGSAEWITHPEGILAHVVRQTPPPNWDARSGRMYHKWWEFKARQNMKDHLGNRTIATPSHDDLVASLTFGTWKYLLPKPVSLGGSASGPQVDLWNQALARNSSQSVSSSGIDSSPGTAYQRTALLVYARNRASHLEPLLDSDELMHWHRTASRLLASVWPGTDALITGPARIPQVIKARPT